MWSRLYIFVCLVYLADVWLGDYGALGQRLKLVLSGMLLAGLTTVMWLDTVVRWGLRSLRTVPMMGRVFLRERQWGQA